MLARVVIFPLLAVLFSTASGQTVGPFQASGLLPYGLDVASPVYLAASDPASISFQTHDLPGMYDLVQGSLREYAAQTGPPQGYVAYDPSKITLTDDAAVRGYFLSSQISNNNALGYSTSGGSPLSPTAGVAFPSTGQSFRDRTETAPLRSGDFVELGALPSGSKLDFFALTGLQNTESGPTATSVLSTDSGLNVDGRRHAVALAAPGSPFLIVGFGTTSGALGGNYNDLVFVFDIGPANIAALPPMFLTALGAPEPGLPVSGMLAAASMLGLSRGRRR